MGFVVLSNDGIRRDAVLPVRVLCNGCGAFLVVMIVANSTGREDVEA